MSRQLRLKAEGLGPHLAELVEKLESSYIVVKTSRIIEHKEDDLSHVYLTLLGIRVHAPEVNQPRSHGQELRSPGVADGDVRDREKDPAGKVPIGT